MPQPLLSAGVAQEYVGEGTSNMELAARVESLNDRMEELEQSIEMVQRNAVVTLLNLLAASLKQVAAGKFDLADAPVVTGAASSKWEAIKQRNPGRVAEAIDILLIHGPITTSQLAVNLKMNRTNCSGNLVPRLISMGICQRNGGLLQLRES